MAVYMFIGGRIRLLSTLQKLKERKVRIVINTRDPREHDEGYVRRIINILSQNDSSEVTHRVESTQLAWQTIGFVGLDKYL
jgi:hypothetical protein